MNYHSGPKYRLIFTLSAYQRLRAYITAVDFEISGLGYVDVRKSPNGTVDFIVRRVFLLPQTSSTTFTKLDPKGIATLMMSGMKSLSILPIKLWWHSHGTLYSYWSPKDEETIRGLGKTWMVSVVGNRNEDFLARLDVYEPFRFTTNLTVVIDVPRDSALEVRIREEVAEKVTYVPPDPDESKEEAYDW